MLLEKSLPCKKKKVSLTDLKKRRWKGRKGGKGLYTKEIKAAAQNPTTWPHLELKALLWQYITKVFFRTFLCVDLTFIPT